MKTHQIVLNILLLHACVTVVYGQQVYTIHTSASEFNSGVLNQGWWSDFGGNNTYNDNYCISLAWTAPSYPYPQGIVTRDFFTFDLSGINGTIQSATLLLARGNSGSPNPTETISFWDVQTPAAILNNNIGPDAAVVNDLGSGKNYGSFQASMVGSPNEVLAFPLNSNAIADIDADMGGYFSVGSSMDGEPASGVYRYIFGVTQGIPATLQLTVVPEPSVDVMVAFLAVCAALIGSKKHDTTASYEG